MKMKKLLVPVMALSGLFALAGCDALGGGGEITDNTSDTTEDNLGTVGVKLNKTAEQAKAALVNGNYYCEIEATVDGKKENLSIGKFSAYDGETALWYKLGDEGLAYKALANGNVAAYEYNDTTKKYDLTQAYTAAQYKPIKNSYENSVELALDKIAAFLLNIYSENTENLVKGADKNVTVDGKTIACETYSKTFGVTGVASVSYEFYVAKDTGIVLHFGATGTTAELANGAATATFDVKSLKTGGDVAIPELREPIFIGDLPENIELSDAVEGTTLEKVGNKYYFAMTDSAGFYEDVYEYENGKWYATYYKDNALTTERHEAGSFGGYTSMIQSTNMEYMVPMEYDINRDYNESAETVTIHGYVCKEYVKKDDPTTKAYYNRSLNLVIKYVKEGVDVLDISFIDAGITSTTR